VIGCCGANGWSLCLRRWDVCETASVRLVRRLRGGGPRLVLRCLWIHP